MPDPVSLLPPDATPWEEAVELTSAARRPLPSDLIATVDDPFTCPAHLLPQLAYQFSVDIWETDWPEDKKRSVIAQAIELAQLKGTEEGIRRHVALVDARVLQVVAPPQGLYLAPPPEKSEEDAYIRLLPELRVYLGSTPGRAGPAELFLDRDFLDDGHLTFDIGPALYGRRAVLHRDGVETPLRVVRINTITVEGIARDVEQISLPGDGGAALFLDHDFLDDGYLDAVKVAPQVYTVALDRSYSHEESTLWLSQLSPGYEPVNPRYERASAAGSRDYGLYLDHTYLDDGYLTPDRAPDLVYDRLRLFDPAISAPLGGLGGFLDHDRLGMAPFTAEVLIDAPRTAGRFELFLDHDFLDDAFLVPLDLTRFDRALNAVTIAKGLHDKVLVSFEITRDLTLDDGIAFDPPYPFAARLPRAL